MKKQQIAVITATSTLAAAALAWGIAEDQKIKAAKTAENLSSALRCIDHHNDETNKGTTNQCDGVILASLPNDVAKDFNVAFEKHEKVVKAANEKKAAEKAAQRKAKAERDKAEREAKAKRLEDQLLAIAEREKAAREAKRKADAAFKAEGWWEQEPGIFVRWCTKTCSSADVIGDASYWLMEVWARDRAAGDIYAQINVLQNGTVVGWTNDTAFLAQGQKGVLTFTKYTPGSGSNYGAQLTKFTTRGSW